MIGHARCCQITGQDANLDAIIPLYAGGNGLQLILVARRQEQVGALGSQRLGRSFSQPFIATTDNGNFPANPKSNSFSLNGFPAAIVMMSAPTEPADFRHLFHNITSDKHKNIHLGNRKNSFLKRQQYRGIIFKQCDNSAISYNKQASI